jgi:hypothetical protein
MRKGLLQLLFVTGISLFIGSWEKSAYRFFPKKKRIREFMFADTTNSPCAFLFIYRSRFREGYFENDYNRLTDFMQRAGERFKVTKRFKF